ncbi:hypothetical protein SELR_04590 [Selenomonas ruminantium subsp. lactilytica TAM6421]|uniref:Porin n=1 Tax=Selenomonas ruminantium subsp. lactilytica (strain NBRC 103574 / TAM6421) TaxID=927704 RepID=I0GN30_SELRL|nr:hypothetical protein [Selenomonas ruminantium]BAL82167.1 hypothetical protein SELR_04590 [Selenomonas ruminantium subsp. lactilytica TAM6421]
MINQKKTAAVLLGLTLGMSGSVFAAPASAPADQDLAARIAAIEAQQQQLTKQLDALKKENAKLKRTSKVAESNKNAIKGLKDAQNRVQLHGFGRVSWDNDNILNYSDRNDNRRFYLDLQGTFKVNDRWNFKFQSETNPRYAKSVVRVNNETKYHTGHDDEKGMIQRVWAEGSVGKVSVDVGRRWRGLGFQNVLFGNETDGIVLGTDIPKSKLQAKAFHLSPTDKGYHFNVTGVGVQGEVSRGLQINSAVLKTNVGKHDYLGTEYYDGAYHDPIKNTAGTWAYVISGMWNPAKNLFLIGDYARTTAASYEANGTTYKDKDYTALRLNYRWSNIDNPGSFQLYARWYDYAKNANNLVGVFGDKEWGALQPGSRGWILGFKYVPAKNIEWETFYEFAKMHKITWGDTDKTYHRNFIRTQIDYHF